jgi:hypothetical protein
MLAFVILWLAFLLVPTLLFGVVLTTVISMSYIASAYHTGNPHSIFMAGLLTTVDLCLVIAARMLIKWLRS